MEKVLVALEVTLGEVEEVKVEVKIDDAASVKTDLAGQKRTHKQRDELKAFAAGLGVEVNSCVNPSEIDDNE